MDFSTQQLRQQILSLAIQGKLVPQIASEGNAKDLLQKIETERKKSNPKYKPLPPVTDEEKPFEIPESWCWCRLGEVVDLINGRAYKQDELLEHGKYKVLRVGNFFTNQSWYYSDLELPEDKYCNKGDLLYAWSASFGPQIWEGEKTIFHYHIWNVKFDNKIIFKKYLFYFFEYDKSHIANSTTGSTMIHVSMENMKPRKFPLPPLPEQKRIVEKLEELLGELDTIEQTKEQIEHYAEQLQGQILQTAIQGKLVPQIASEGNAQDLLQKIEAERKKSNPKYKPLPPVTDEEKPFEIPESWVWVRLSSITSSILYGVSESAKTKGKYKLLRITDIQNNKVNWETVPFTDFEESKVSNYILQKDDILFARTGGTVGKSYLVNECPNNSIYASYLIRVRLFDDVYARYVKLFFESPFYWYQVIDKASGTGQPNCNGEKLTNLVLPLPPLSEQKRIVEKLEELLPLCEKIGR